MLNKFKNLSAEMARKGVTQKQTAIDVNIRPETFSRKLAGKSDFTLSEIKRIRDYIDPALKIEYLFQEDE